MDQGTGNDNDPTQRQHSDTIRVTADVVDRHDKLLRACERCWKRKQKCDRKAPICSACLENNADCRVRVPEVDLLKNANKTISHVSGYVSSLKRKTAELREELQNKRVRVDQSNDHDITHVSPTETGRLQPVAVTTPSISGLSGSIELGPGHGHETGDAEDRSVHAAMGEIGYLSLSAMAEPRDSHGDLAQPLSLRTLLQAATNLTGAEPYHSTIMKQHTTVPSSKFDLMSGPLSISRETTLEFVHLFIEQISHNLPGLHQDQVLEYYNSVFPENDTKLDVGNASNLRDAIVCNIIAIGMLLSREASALKGFAAKLYASTLESIPNPLENEQPILALHFQISLIIYSMYSPSGGSVWHFLGIAVRRCIALGYHRESELRDRLPEKDIVSRRLLFWTIYILDRTLAAIMDRPFAIPDEDIALELPSLLNDPITPITYHILLYAQLISSMRSAGPRDIIYDWYNFSFWNERVPKIRTMPNPINSIGCFVKQLSCRAMVQLVTSSWVIQFSPTGINNVDIVTEVQKSCIDTITCLHERCEEDDYATNFVDIYDLFAFAIVYLALSFRANSKVPASEMAEIVSKVSTMLTLFTKEFRSLAIFRKIVWALHSYVTAKPDTQTFVSNLDQNNFDKNVAALTRHLNRTPLRF